MSAPRNPFRPHRRWVGLTDRSGCGEGQGRTRCDRRPRLRRGRREPAAGDRAARRCCDRWAVSAPMVLVAVGIVIGLTPLPDGLPLDPQANRGRHRARHRARRAGRADGRRPGARPPARAAQPRVVGRWSPTWRLLGDRDAAVHRARSRCSAGARASRRRPRSCSAPCSRRPTRCSPPTSRSPGRRPGDHEVDETDEVRFTLTSEAGLNDGLAFPFVYAAILLATEGACPGWGLEWVGCYLVGKVVDRRARRPRGRRVLAPLAFRSRSRVAAGGRARRVAARARGAGRGVRRR